MTIFDKIKKASIGELIAIERRYGMMQGREDWFATSERLERSAAPAVRKIGKIYEALALRLGDIS